MLNVGLSGYENMSFIDDAKFMGRLYGNNQIFTKSCVVYKPSILWKK